MTLERDSEMSPGRTQGARRGGGLHQPESTPQEGCVPQSSLPTPTPLLRLGPHEAGNYPAASPHFHRQGWAVCSPTQVGAGGAGEAQVSRGSFLLDS